MNDHNKTRQGELYESAFACDEIHYDSFLLPPNDYVREKYFARVRPMHGQRVLETGIGVSSFLCRMVQRYGVDAYGFDYVSSSLRAQKSSSPCNLKLCRGDAETLPYKSESFDTVIAVSVIEHLSSYSCAFGEIWRVLKPGGVLLLQLPCSDFRFSLFARFKSYESLHTAAWFQRIERETGHDFKRIPERAGWKALALQNGFVVDFCDAADVLVDSWMMYYVYSFLKEVQSAVIRLKRRYSLPHGADAPAAGAAATDVPQSLKKYSGKRRVAGWIWYHIILKAFWLLCIPERQLRKRPIGAAVYMALRKGST